MVIENYGIFQIVLAVLTANMLILNVPVTAVLTIFATALHDARKTNFNCRLCRARRVVENTVGILTHKWRLFRRPMECTVETAIDVVKATTCLHNYIIVKRGNNDIDF